MKNLMNQVNLRYTMVNPFLLSPIKGVLKDGLVNIDITYAYALGNELHFGYETAAGYSTTPAYLVEVFSFEKSKLETLLKNIK